MAFNLKPSPKYTINKSIRFPENLVKEIEKAIINTNVSFSGFVIQACEYVLSENNKNNSNKNNK